ncbi:hypothetical protein IWQ60_008992 [Tieghemiomyces parasiticus]|uniref:Uncharacterized protein n=1 Tax=Tieghemiomyces parasiticus TaxID=78921 RepID=A0A9W7ZWE5_9FUNG|nr:hypothetical protein IWQ60_008992 [Tieghemiomyces parasiticus]
MARDGLAVTSEFLEADLANMSQEMGDRLFTPNQMSVSHTHSLSSDNPTFVATPPSGSKQHPQTQEPQNHPSELDSILGMSFYDLLNLPPPQVDTSMFDQSAQQLSLNPDSIATSSNLAPQPLAAELHSGKKRTRSAKTAKTVSTRSSRRNRLDPAAKKAQPLHVAQLEEAEEYGTIPNRKVNVHDDNDARRNARGPVGNADNKHVPIADVSLDSAGYSHNSNRNWEQLGRPRGSGVRQAAGGANKADTPPTIASAESHPSDRPEFDLSINVNLQRYYQNQNTGSPPDLSMVMPQALKIMAVDQEQLESTDGLMQSLPPISGDPAATSTDSGSNSPAYATYRNTGLLYDAIARKKNAHHGHFAGYP